MIVTAVDPSLLVESRASPLGWTGETPVPPPHDSSRGHGNSARSNSGAAEERCRASLGWTAEGGRPYVYGWTAEGGRPYVYGWTGEGGRPYVYGTNLRGGKLQYIHCAVSRSLRDRR